MGSLKSLGSLQLGSSYGGKNRITDAGLVHLLPLTRLDTLYLDNTAVTDNGLAELAKLPALKTLGLSGNEITARGLMHIRAMKNLKRLSLHESAIRTADIAELQRELPNWRLSPGFNPAAARTGENSE